MIAIRESPELRKSRLGKLNQAEAGIRGAIRRETALATHQNKPPQVLTTSKLSKAADVQRSLAKESRTIESWSAATDDDLTAARSVEPFIVSLDEVSKELIEYLAKKPDDFRKLDPRKFEEVVYEILTDQGYDAVLTDRGNDGGRDILVPVPSSLGTFLTLVECKRWDKSGNVPKSIVERFVYTVREQDKANMGIIVSSTGFASGGKKVAATYDHLIKLADVEVLTEMAARYGTWGDTGSSQIWMPNY